MKTPKGRDHATRIRLRSGASRLFAERGYAKVTVRDICRSAGANVAAVNYHYGGKLGLYQHVVQSAIQTMQSTTEEAREAGREKSAKEQLRVYVRVFITRIVARAGRDTWIHELMMREISDPTPALDLVLEQVIRPRMAYLCGIVGALLGCPLEDPRVWRCAFSIHAQCLALMNHPIAARLNPAFAMRPNTIDAMVDHITEFSLAGLESLAK